MLRYSQISVTIREKAMYHSNSLGAPASTRFDGTEVEDQAESSQHDGNEGHDQADRAKLSL